MSFLNIFLISTIFPILSYASYRLSMWSVLTRLQETKTKDSLTNIKIEYEMLYGSAIPTRDFYYC